MFKALHPRLLYGLAALLALAELVIFWLALHPAVAPDYAAYFLDRTTTCLNQPVSGAYTLGETLSFKSEGYGPARTVRVCGWEGPAGDGTHSVGTTSRLRFAVPAPSRPLVLTLAIAAYAHAGDPRQSIAVTGNGVSLGDIALAGGATQSFDVAVPPSALAVDPGRLDITLSYRNAIRMGPDDPDTRLRAIKLLSARLAAGEG